MILVVVHLSFFQPLLQKSSKVRGLCKAFGWSLRCPGTQEYGKCSRGCCWVGDRATSVPPAAHAGTKPGAQVVFLCITAGSSRSPRNRSTSAQEHEHHTWASQPAESTSPALPPQVKESPTSWKLRQAEVRSFRGTYQQPVWAALPGEAQKHQPKLLKFQLPLFSYRATGKSSRKTPSLFLKKCKWHGRKAKGPNKIRLGVCHALSPAPLPPLPSYKKTHRALLLGWDRRNAAAVIPR